jgi:hypothetical protein
MVEAKHVQGGCSEVDIKPPKICLEHVGVDGGRGVADNDTDADRDVQKHDLTDQRRSRGGGVNAGCLVA